mmetsp:Transcript_2458/g.4407  ORF Transcript_2458/g.4407 Transcript_2458/m.4407 type:complete len:723 (+) Transcript_2458:119-2287(+)
MFLWLLLIMGWQVHSRGSEEEERVLHAYPSPQWNLYSYHSADPTVLTRKGGGEEGENYGLGIASCGHRVFIGSYTDKYHYVQTGAIYIYSTSAEGTWNLESKLHPSYTSSEAYFGWSVTCEGNGTVAVGAYGDNSLNIQKAGAVYLYSYVEASSSRSVRGTWQEQGIFYSNNPQEHEYFGWAVAIDGDIMAVSAVGNAEMYTACGVVYVFKYTGSAAARRLQDNDDGGDDSNDDVDGDNDNINNDNDDYQYTPSLPAGWELESVIAPTDPYAYMNFGWSLSLSDQVVVVSAPWMLSRRGVVYVYERELTENSAYDDIYYMNEGEYTYTLMSTVYSGSLTKDADLFEIDTKSYFGHSVAIDGDVVVIGHHLGHSYTSESTSVSGHTGDAGSYTSSRTGRVFVCRLDQSGTSPGTGTVTLIADLGDIVSDRIKEYSFFGYDVSISGRTIIVGSPGDINYDGNASVFLFSATDDSRNDWVLTEHWQGVEYKPQSPDYSTKRLEPSRFGIATAVNDRGNLVFASDSHGMSVDYIQTGCVFAWTGFWIASLGNDISESSSSGWVWLSAVLLLSLGVIIVVVVKKQRQEKRGHVDGILDEWDQSMSMAIGADSDDTRRGAFQVVDRVLSVVAKFRDRCWGRGGFMSDMQMTSLPTESMHDDDGGVHHRPGAVLGSAAVDSRKLIATAQAVADDENHPNHEEVAELIRSYRREWITSERFQKEFQRLIF